MLDRSGAAAYVNAKANGMLQKSFVGSKAARLFSVQSLSELWALLYKEELPAVPEMLLAKEIEKKALEQFVFQYKKLLAMYAKPDKIALTLLQYYDFENLKKIASSLAVGAKQMPDLTDLTPYNLIHYDFWPEISKITEETPFSWYNRVPSIHEMQEFDNRLDLQYMKTLWSAVDSLPFGERKPVRQFVLDDIVLKNILWVLRLKVYYEMEENDILSRLVYESDLHSEKDLFAGPAISIISKDVKDFAAWSDWEYADCLNPHEEGNSWTLDPCWVGQCFRRKENEAALAKIHQYPLSAMVLVCWFKAKQNEYETICAAVEAIRLGVGESQAMELIGVTPSKKR